jgi:hypothetical protein
MKVSFTSRRSFIVFTGVSLLIAGFATGEAGVPPQADFPRMEFVYEAIVTIASPEDVGEVNSGRQRIIPITGGTFEGPALRGKVLPGAADWNLVRSDGVTVVSANYFLRTDDGVVIKIANQGVNSSLPKPATAVPVRPRFTIPSFEAPKGRYDWLNKSVFVGTLTPAAPGSVRIRIFKLV